MKKTLFILTLFISVNSFAQDKIAFPFQGGNKAMTQFFRDSLKISKEIIKTKATGSVIFKFSADEKGNIKNLVIYYADDVILAPPAIEALRKSNHKWIIPDNEKMHDFVLPFLIKFKASDEDDTDTQVAMHTFYSKRKPIVARDQIPLNLTTLLPTVVVNYEPEK
jgi:hypothetical protein